MFKRTVCLIVILALLALAAPVVARNIENAEPIPVEVEATDGHPLIGDLFLPTDHTDDSNAPAVLLMHMMGSNKRGWTFRTSMVDDLLNAGYVVVAVDLRGFGETGGSANWPQAEIDVQTWCDWLRAQPGVDPARINMIGASIGSNLALRGMVNDPDIVTVIALSPGLDYVGVSTAEVMPELGKRPVMLVASTQDRPSDEAVKTLIAQARGTSLLQLYESNTHGTTLLTRNPDIIPLMVHWLDLQNRGED